MMFDLTPFVHRTRCAVYDPFREMEDFERNFFSSRVSTFRTDIQDHKDAYLLEAELPGFSKEEIKLSLDGDLLTISAEHESRREEKEDKNEAAEGNAEKKDAPAYVRRERFYGSFSRSFNISEIDTDGIEASYENGILSVRLPKKSAKEPAVRQLPIK